jgi:hypothetical protein
VNRSPGAPRAARPAPPDRASASARVPALTRPSRPGCAQAQAASNSNDPLEKFCGDNPDADECRWVAPTPGRWAALGEGGGGGGAGSLAASRSKRAPSQPRLHPWTPPAGSCPGSHPWGLTRPHRSLAPPHTHHPPRRPSRLLLPLLQRVRGLSVRPRPSVCSMGPDQRAASPAARWLGPCAADSAPPSGPVCWRGVRVCEGEGQLAWQSSRPADRRSVAFAPALTVRVQGVSHAVSSSGASCSCCRGPAADAPAVCCAACLPSALSGVVQYQVAKCNRFVDTARRAPTRFGQQ